MTREVLALGPFLTSLEQRLAELSAEQLRQIVVQHGTQLPPGERADFLRIFAAADTDAADPHAAASHHDPELLPQAEAFVAAIVKGDYAEGCGFDPEYGDYRTFGDESWTTEMEDLLDRAGAAFLAGNATLASRAYQVLLEALIDEEAVSNFPGAGTPEEMITCDVGEAKARYLRSVWESEPLATRATALVEAAEAISYVGNEPTLEALNTTRREPLPDLDRTLPALIATLSELRLEGYGFGPQARRLRAEAMQRLRGVDGLAELARAAGSGRAEAYRDWVDALAKTGRWDDAEQAAREALTRLDPHGGVRAGLADRLAMLALVRNDPATLLDARRDAWHADPALQRLLRLVEAASTLGRRDEVLTEEASRLAARPPTKRSDLVAILLLLTGQVEEASVLLVAQDPVLGEQHGDPAPVVVPFLLVGGSGASADGRWPCLLLRGLLNQVNGLDRRHGSDTDLDDFRAALPAAAQTASLGDDLQLSSLFIDALSRLPAEALRRRWLDRAQAHIEARVDAVVGGQHRGYYQRVAELAAACAEAIILASGAPAGQAYLTALHDRHPRHSLFRKELRSAAARSPLL